MRLWVLDEHRYGLLPVIRRVWGLRGVRVHAPYATRYQWGCLHEAMEVDGANRLELLFTPCLDQDVHTLFLQQLGATEPAALHVVIQDQGDSTCRQTTRGCPTMSACCRCRPTVRNLTPSRNSATS